MKRKKVFSFALLFVLVAAVVAAGCIGGKTTTQSPTSPTETTGTQTTQQQTETQGTETTTSPQYGGKVVIAIPMNPKDLDPRTYPDVYSYVVIRQVFEPLVAVNEKMEPIPWLAESWEHNEDGTEWVFYLRKGIKFHDGQELTAGDVKFTFDTIRDPALASPRIDDYKMIESVEIIDRYTVKFKLKYPYAPFLVDTMTLHIVPKHAVEKMGKEFSSHPIGTGPFKFVEWVQDDHITLVANKEYWRKGLPRLDEVIIRIIPEASVQVMSLEAGEVDFIYSVPPEDLERLKKNPNIEVGMYTGNNFRFFAFNCNRTPFNDVRVRQAIAYALNKEDFLKIWGDLAVSATGPIPPHSWAYYGDAKKYQQNIEKAKQLLAEAGYPNGFEMTLMVSPGEREALEAALFQEQLEKVGIKVKIEQLEWGVFLDKLFAKDYDVLRVGWTGPMDPDGYVRIFHSEAGWNFMAYSNPEIDKLIEEGQKTLDIEKRKDIYRRIQEIFAEDVPMIFLFHEKRARAYNTKLGGLTRWVEVMGFGPLGQLEEWYWKEQK